MSRREAREAAFMFIYQIEFRPKDLESQRELFLNRYHFNESDLDFFDTLVSNVNQKKSEIDKVFEPLLVGWRIDRLPRVDLTILRICTYELISIPDVPVSASISEAVILAKRYGSDDSRSYINAVLGKIQPGAKNE